MREIKPKLVGGIGNKWGTQFHQQNRIYDTEQIAMCIPASLVSNKNGGGYYYLMSDLRIRKLTPKECWRLMGFSDIDYEKAKQVNSETQLYKQAGNSIVVNVLEAIFKEMIERTNNDI